MLYNHIETHSQANSLSNKDREFSLFRIPCSSRGKSEKLLGEDVKVINVQDMRLSEKDRHQ
jgi:hypothetical protein